MQQGLSQSQPLAHPQGIGLHLVMDTVLQSDLSHHFVDPGLGYAPGHPPIVDEVLVTGQKIVHLRIFHDPPHMGEGLFKVLLQVDAVDEDLPAVMAISPTIMRMVVVFPAPLGPKNRRLPPAGPGG